MNSAAGLLGGVLGDTVNDAASHHASIEISSLAGADVAKDGVDVVLLERDLGVLAAGVMEGQRIFGNTMKYVLMAMPSRPITRTHDAA